MPPTPEVRLNGRRASTASLRGTPSKGAPGGDGWGSNFWVTLVDPQTQVSFYACPATGEVSWDPPAGNFLLPPSPDGEWWEMFDEASGLPYYYQTKTGETVWERPNTFVIPLGVLQNTALTRRLSLTHRAPQIASKNGHKHISDEPERAPYRRSRSYLNEREAAGQNHKNGSGPLQHRRSQSSTRSSPGRTTHTPPSPTSASPRTSSRGNSGRKSSTEHLHHNPGSQGSPLAYERGHPLAPIPGSPYNTDADAATSPAPSDRDQASAPATPSGRRRDATKKDSPHQKSKTDDATPGRSRSKSSSYMQYRSPQPQSLTAALEMIALSNSQSSGSQDKSSVSENGHGARTPLQESPPRVKINTDPKMLSGASLGDTLHTPETPLRFKFRISKDKSVPPSPSRPIPAAPQLRGRQISSPVLNPEASQHMSQIVDRNGSTPIPIDIYQKTGRTASFNTGKYPVLPQDLASDIQQFAESDFAQRYFSTHRTGFIFKRKIPVAQIMTWQKTPISSPLLNLNRSLHKDAVRTFRIIQRIMGDRDRDRDRDRSGPMTPVSPLNASTTSLHSSNMSHALVEDERWLLGQGLSHGELRDEIYCQVMKQLNGNPNPESTFKGWQFLCVLLVTFPPSKNFEAYLRTYIQQATNHHAGRVDVMAKYCLRRLAYISKKGPRGKPPSAAEIETASDAAFNPSIFGESLDTVFRLQERNYPDKKVPIILPFLADGILALGGTKSEGIFRVPGDGDLVSELKLRIDKGYYSLDGVDDPHVLASLLKLWLRELCDPLVPDELYNDCITNSHDPEACVQIVHRLPTINRRVVLFVISFLQLFLEEKTQAVTKMTSVNLALVMAPNLLRCNSESMLVVFTNSQYEQRFVHNLLLHLKPAEVDPDFVPTHGHGAISATPTPTPIPASAPRLSKSNKRTHRPNH
ncbi:RhoGAP-domain-containing protein [Polyporus arcularius HHB13444]|uniref:RhoGAP-domain-containing protein n=1 Tax=Polyporus arcularius HHB13444 TaxID=1314778 RepID=A0A5C3PBA0_9APHY|nr:RhoGAP-domain-containing protein [Polyporus arcularius HHB13444]